MRTRRVRLRRTPFAARARRVSHTLTTRGKTSVSATRVCKPMARPGSLWTDQELIQRMRADDHFAYREYFARFQPLLVDRARLLGVQPALRDEMAMDTLGDAAMTLTRYTRPVPQSLTGYLVRALHHRAARAARGESMGSDAEEDDVERV